MSKKHRWLLASILAGVIVVAGASVVYAAGSGNGIGGLAGPPQTSSTDGISVGPCRAGRLSFANHGDSLTTTSTTFVDVPGATVNFNIGGQARVCLVVDFSSMAFASSELLYVRAVLNPGAIIGAPADTQFDGDSDENGNGQWSRTHSAQFTFQAVTPGAKTVQMQFRSNGGGSVFLHRGTTVVHHK